jgi:hypothetical protein
MMSEPQLRESNAFAARRWCFDWASLSIAKEKGSDTFSDPEKVSDPFSFFP